MHGFDEVEEISSDGVRMYVRGGGALGWEPTTKESEGNHHHRWRKTGKGTVVQGTGRARFIQAVGGGRDVSSVVATAGLILLDRDKAFTDG